MTFYVYRTRQASRDGSVLARAGITCDVTGRGFRSHEAAEREAESWRADGWLALVVPSTPELRRHYRAWSRGKDSDSGRARTRADRALRLAMSETMARLSSVLVLSDGNAHEGTLMHDDDGRPIVELATCPECGLTWNDALGTSITPTPSARCPNEYDHDHEE